MRELAILRRYVGMGRLGAYCFSDLLCRMLTTGVALLLSALLDAVSSSIDSGSVSSVMSLTAFSCGYSVILGTSLIATGALRTSAVRKAMVGVRMDAACGLMKVGLKEGADNSSDHLTILGQNMDTLEVDLFDGALRIIDAALQIVIGIAMLLYVNPFISIIALVCMALPTLVPRLFGKRLAAQQQQVVSDTGAYNGRVRDNAQGGEIIRSFHVEPFMLEALRGATERLQGHKQELSRTMVLVEGLSNTVGVAMQFAIMGVTGVSAVMGAVSVGSVVAVTQLSGAVISPAAQLSDQLGKLRATYPILSRIEELSKAAHEANPAEVREVKDSIGFEDVSFAYGSAAKPVVRSCSMRFRAGGKYAIIGQSGCGKSTLLGLASGRLHPTSGTVRVDGRTDVMPDAAFVHQNVFLFDDTLRQNITLGGRFTDAQIQRTIHLADLDEVVAVLPQGLDTPVEENGSRFSGGERQRIAIARALLHGKTTLFVDEATSALDAARARKVEDTLLSLEGVTVIEVTHHLSAERAPRYDAVLEMRDGGLAHVGPDQVGAI